MGTFCNGKVPVLVWEGMVYMTLQDEERAAERKPTVLLVDDEPQIIDFLRVGFGYEGFDVSVATTGPDALHAISEQQPDIVILDIMLPGLDIGADDYITKPFAFKELMARVRAVLRRHGKHIGDVLTFQGVTLNRATRIVTRDERPIELTPREFELLEFFLMHPRQVLKRDAILARVWGYNYVGDDNVIEVYVRHLREKLEDDPPQLVQTVRGVGYVLRG